MNENNVNQMYQLHQSNRGNAMNFVQIILTIFRQINNDVLTEVLRSVHFNYSADAMMNPN